MTWTSAQRPGPAQRQPARPRCAHRDRGPVNGPTNARPTTDGHKQLTRRRSPQITSWAGTKDSPHPPGTTPGPDSDLLKILRALAGRAGQLRNVRGPFTTLEGAQGSPLFNLGHILQALPRSDRPGSLSHFFKRCKFFEYFIPSIFGYTSFDTSLHHPHTCLGKSCPSGVMPRVNARCGCPPRALALGEWMPILRVGCGRNSVSTLGCPLPL